MGQTALLFRMGAVSPWLNPPVRKEREANPPPFNLPPYHPGGPDRQAEQIPQRHEQ